MKDEFESNAPETSNSSKPSKDEFAKAESAGLSRESINQVRTWAEWAKDSSIHRLKGFLRDDVFVKTELSMIYGPGGSGKSYLAFHVGICVAMALPVHRMTTRRGRVLFLSEEMPRHVIHMRTMMMLPIESAEEMGDMFNIGVSTGLDFANLTLKSQQKLEALILKYGAELVFIDCLADIHTGDENSNPAMGAVMKAIRSVARATECCIVLVHHMGKPGEDGKTRGARGASVMKDTCEAQIEVKPIGKNGEPRSLVSFVKARHVVGRVPPSFEFAQEENLHRMIDVSDPDEPTLMKPAVTFSTADHSDSSTTDRALVLVRNIVGRMAESREDHQVSSLDVLSAIMKESECSERKAVEAIQRAKKVGLVVSISAGRKLCLPGS